MERIIAPVIRNDRGSAVHNLQDGLLLLLTADGSELPEADRRALAAEQSNGADNDVTNEIYAKNKNDMGNTRT